MPAPPVGVPYRPCWAPPAGKLAESGDGYGKVAACPFVTLAEARKAAAGA